MTSLLLILKLFALYHTKSLSSVLDQGLSHKFHSTHSSVKHLLNVEYDENIEVRMLSNANANFITFLCQMQVG